jgi:hypothetical protein
MSKQSLEDIRQNGVKLQLGGKERTLKFDLNAFADLEEEFGDIDKAMAAMTSGSIVQIRKVLFYGLRHEDEALTERQVGAMITIPQLKDMTADLLAAIGQSVPDVDDEAAAGKSQQEEAKVEPTQV